MVAAHPHPFGSVMCVLVLTIGYRFSFIESFAVLSNRNNVINQDRGIGLSRSTSALSMDLQIEEQLFRGKVEMEDVLSQNRYNLFEEVGVLERPENKHGMPWKESIAGEGAPLLYMPFWEWQLSFMKRNLSNLRNVECTSSGSTSFPTSTKDFSYKENTEKKARIVNLCYESDEYRKIRMTYYDAGEACQVFNSVFYPRGGYNVPLLGVDVLSFHGKKFLAIVDFQPLYEQEEQHHTTFEESILKPIRDDYPSLKGQMSAKFYDETQFFSRQMLFSRFEEGKIIQEELFPAFQRYVCAHLDLVKSTPSKTLDSPKVMSRHAAYDTYSAERDPATGLFAGMFGKEWADEFVHGFLFDKSEKGGQDNLQEITTSDRSSSSNIEERHKSSPAKQSGRVSRELVRGQ